MGLWFAWGLHAGLGALAGARGALYFLFGEKESTKENAPRRRAALNRRAAGFNIGIGVR
mgnify:CR=1 FL=1